VHLAVPPGDVDVNIHPSKSEVRLAGEREVHASLYRAVANALAAAQFQSRTLDDAAISSAAPALDDQGPAMFPLPATPAPDSTPMLSALPALRVFGQTNATFIIAEGPQGLYMIDQHAAHERILYDRLEEQVSAGTIPSQPLLEPVALDVTPLQMQALEENAELLGRLGFLLEPFGNGACLVRAVPALTRAGGPMELVSEVLAELETLPEPVIAQERALSSLACHAAVKAGQSLDVREMREIVEQLERTRRPSTCPHGRPTMIHLSHSQLEREFGRR
jgi:DNA mismatch repair protein MutL